MGVQSLVRNVMGYELWLYRKGNEVLSTHLRQQGIDASKAQEYKCNPRTKEGCNAKQKAYIEKIVAGGSEAITVETARLEAIRGRAQTPDKETKALRRLAILEGLASTSSEGGGPASGETPEQHSPRGSTEL